jgi:hypothetical protein
LDEFGVEVGEDGWKSVRIKVVDVLVWSSFNDNPMRAWLVGFIQVADVEMCIIIIVVVIVVVDLIDELITRVNASENWLCLFVGVQSFDYLSRLHEDDDTLYSGNF